MTKRSTRASRPYVFTFLDDMERRTRRRMATADGRDSSKVGGVYGPVFRDEDALAFIGFAREELEEHPEGAALADYLIFIMNNDDSIDLGYAIRHRSGAKRGLKAAAASRKKNSEERDERLLTAAAKLPGRTINQKAGIIANIVADTSQGLNVKEETVKDIRKILADEPPLSAHRIRRILSNATSRNRLA